MARDSFLSNQKKAFELGGITRHFDWMRSGKLIISVEFTADSFIEAFRKVTNINRRFPNIAPDFRRLQHFPYHPKIPTDKRRFEVYNALFLNSIVALFNRFSVHLTELVCSMTFSLFLGESDKLGNN